jgi:hypothetical protein
VSGPHSAPTKPFGPIKAFGVQEHNQKKGSPALGDLHHHIRFSHWRKVFCPKSVNISIQLIGLGVALKAKGQQRIHNGPIQDSDQVHIQIQIEISGGTLGHHNGMEILIFCNLSSNFFFIHQLIRLNFRFKEVLELQFRLSMICREQHLWELEVIILGRSFKV